MRTSRVIYSYDDLGLVSQICKEESKWNVCVSYQIRDGNRAKIIVTSNDQEEVNTCSDKICDRLSDEDQVMAGNYTSSLDCECYICQDRGIIFMPTQTYLATNFESIADGGDNLWVNLTRGLTPDELYTSNGMNGAANKYSQILRASDSNFSFQTMLRLMVLQLRY
ncbi:MAG: hypothetical protein R3C17_10650 [Planctomycetaceae bacterium]